MIFISLRNVDPVCALDFVFVFVCFGRQSIGSGFIAYKFSLDNIPKEETLYSLCVTE